MALRAGELTGRNRRCYLCLSCEKVDAESVPGTTRNRDSKSWSLSHFGTLGRMRLRLCNAGSSPRCVNSQIKFTRPILWLLRRQEFKATVLFQRCWDHHFNTTGSPTATSRFQLTKLHSGCCDLLPRGLAPPIQWSCRAHKRSGPRCARPTALKSHAKAD